MRKRKYCALRFKFELHGLRNFQRSRRRKVGVPLQIRIHPELGWTVRLRGRLRSRRTTWRLPNVPFEGIQSATRSRSLHALSGLHGSGRFADQMPVHGRIHVDQFRLRLPAWLHFGGRNLPDLSQRLVEALCQQRRVHSVRQGRSRRKHFEHGGLDVQDGGLRK